MPVHGKWCCSSSAPSATNTVSLPAASVLNKSVASPNKGAASPNKGAASPKDLMCRSIKPRTSQAASWQTRAYWPAPSPQNTAAAPSSWSVLGLVSRTGSRTAINRACPMQSTTLACGACCTCKCRAFSSTLPPCLAPPDAPLAFGASCGVLPRRSCMRLECWGDTGARLWSAIVTLVQGFVLLS